MAGVFEEKHRSIEWKRLVHGKEVMFPVHKNDKKFLVPD